MVHTTRSHFTVRTYAAYSFYSLQRLSLIALEHRPAEVCHRTDGLITAFSSLQHLSQTEVCHRTDGLFTVFPACNISHRSRWSTAHQRLANTPRRVTNSFFPTCKIHNDELFGPLAARRHKDNSASLPIFLAVKDGPLYSSSVHLQHLEKFTHCKRDGHRQAWRDDILFCADACLSST